MPRSIAARDSIAVMRRCAIGVGAVTPGFWLRDKLIGVALNEGKNLFVNQEFRKELESRKRFAARPLRSTRTTLAFWSAASPVGLPASQSR